MVPQVPDWTPLFTLLGETQQDYSLPLIHLFINHRYWL